MKFLLLTKKKKKRQVALAQSFLMAYLSYIQNTKLANDLMLPRIIIESDSCPSHEFTVIPWNDGPYY